MKTKPLIYCHNHDVAVGAYECPCANLVNNSIVCTSKECCYNSEHIRFTSSSANAIVVDNSLEDEIDECLSCPYYNPEAPDCCTYAPDACYYDTDPDTYPF